MEWLSLVPWSGLGWGGLIFAAVLAIIKGALIPTGTHEREMNMLLDVIHRERLLTDRAMSALRLMATEYGTTADKVLSALPLEEGADNGSG